MLRCTYGLPAPGTSTPGNLYNRWQAFGVTVGSKTRLLRLTGAVHLADGAEAQDGEVKQRARVAGPVWSVGVDLVAQVVGLGRDGGEGPERGVAHRKGLLAGIPRHLAQPHNLPCEPN